MESFRRTTWRIWRLDSLTSRKLTNRKRKISDCYLLICGTSNCSRRSLDVIGDKEGITVDVLIGAIDGKRNDPELVKSYTAQLRGLFDLMDVNCDGFLDKDEYLRLHLEHGMQDATYTEEAFKAIDTDQDGKVSFDEVVDALFDFIFSEDEKSPYVHFFGPLVD